MFSHLGPGEIILIVLVILVLFGGKKIPEFVQGIGKGLKEFKKAVNEDEEKAPDSKDNKDTESKK